ncbi:MAG: sterol desaturase family protein, partial [Saprospiraceae bacterium]|nr:sterol desaturase family protein [Saprospiraceae bacterium]
MEKYFEVFVNGYRGYARYLWHEVLHPHWGNYFYWLIGISAVVYVLELLFPWRKNQHAIRKDFWLDMFYMFFNFFLFGLVGYAAVSDVFVNAFNDLLASVLGIRNLVAINIAELPRWSQLLTLFIVRDFIQWNTHRLLHRVPWLWKFHKVHHSVEQMGFAAHLRYHFMETIVYRSIEYIPLAMIGFGIQDFILVHLFTLTIGHLNHANIYLPLGPLQYIFNSPQMHIWHHSKELPRGSYGVNYG